MSFEKYSIHGNKNMLLPMTLFVEIFIFYINLTLKYRKTPFLLSIIFIDFRVWKSTNILGTILFF